jgi:hypothetical protein
MKDSKKDADELPCSAISNFMAAIGTYMGKDAGVHLFRLADLKGFTSLIERYVQIVISLSRDVSVPVCSLMVLLNRFAKL